MATLLEEVIDLANTVTALNAEQKERILKVAPTLSESDLENLKKMITDVRDSFDSAKHEIEIREEVASKFKIYTKEKKVEELHETEAKEQSEDVANAETLLNNI
jgi:hypothetical protein